LRNALTSLQNLDFVDELYEVLVVDNKSEDDTPRVVAECSKHGKKEIGYYKELRDGLHNARHAGAQIAKGEILAYIDDDAICDPNWLLELTKPFADSEVACVGGKVVPRYETQEPVWAKYFPSFLGLINMSDKVIEVKQPVHGGNCAIRKNALYELGGFHPDAMPRRLIKYRGDGEDGLFKKALEKGYKIIYTPFAEITHVIPKERVAVKYLKQRAFEQGISDSFIAIRKKGGIGTKDVFSWANAALSTSVAFCRAIRTGGLEGATYNVIAWMYHLRGAKYHRKEVSNNKMLFEFVLQDDYLNKKAPD
jgi:glycosyltransferase involved in cell wall biosynthesis